MAVAPTIDFENLDAGYMVMVAAIMLAQERQSLSISHACAATGLTHEQYKELRTEIVRAGMKFQRRLAAGLAQHIRADG